MRHLSGCLPVEYQSAGFARSSGAAAISDRHDRPARAAKLARRRLPIAPAQQRHETGEAAGASAQLPDRDEEPSASTLSLWERAGVRACADERITRNENRVNDQE